MSELTIGTLNSLMLLAKRHNTVGAGRVTTLEQPRIVYDVIGRD